MNRRIRSFVAIMLSLASAFAPQVGAQSSGGPYRVNPSVVADGGASLSGGTFQLKGTLGQSATATLSATTYRFHGGFWVPAANSQMPDPIFSNGFDS
jgi:hypothetical protein